MRPQLLCSALSLCPFIAARTCLLIGARTSPSLSERRTPEKEEAREKGARGPWRRFGSSASEGGRLRVMGMRLTGGDWPFGVASFRGYAIDCQRSISFVV